MGEDFIVSSDYSGTVFLGWAQGTFESDRRQRIPYYNMFVLSPVSSFESEDYKAFGYKAEKKKCVSPDVWKDLKPGDRVKLFFDDKSRVMMVALDG